MSDAFNLLDTSGKVVGPAALERRRIPKGLSDHREAARTFQPDKDLVAAVNVALALGAPLLLTGEPGTGKTQVAFFLAYVFGLEDALYPLYVRSNTTASDLLYRFDSVAYFHAAQDPKRRPGEALSRKEFVHKGPLWRAYESQGPAIVLLDEIDKAPRDFPNDLLNVLDQHRFDVPETGERVERRPGAPPPVVVVTSNSERRLPEPFLRRCVFHQLELSDTLIDRAVRARAGDFPRLDEDTRGAAIERFRELCAKPLRKKPATAELLAWLAVLSAQGAAADGIRSARLKDLPALGVLVKDREDLAQL